MAPNASLSPLNCNRLISFSPLFLSPTCKSYKIHTPSKLHRNTYAYGQSHPTFSYQNSSISRNLYSLRPRETFLIAFDAKNSASGEGDNEALDAVLRLHSAIKNKNYQELSKILADECLRVSNVLSFFQAFQDKMQVREFFYDLKKKYGQNFQLVVKSTMLDGLKVHAQGSFAWMKMRLRLGKEFCFNIWQPNQWKAIIRYIEIFMGPLLYFELLRLKMMAGLITAFIDKIGSLMTLDSEKKAIKILFIVLSLLLFLMLTSRKDLP